jgi:uncharacterized protein involved in exopolysaccharide biosynthesis
MDQVTPSSHSAAVDDDITLAEYFNLIRRVRWLILGFVAVCTVGGALTGLLLPAKYTADIVLAPVSHTSGTQQLGNLATLASQFSGLASLAGISVGQDTERAETLAVLKSNALTERYIAENDLLPKLYPKLWDQRTKRWRTSNPTKIPTLWKASRLFRRKIRTITTNGKTGIITLKITWINANEAARWANGLVALTNSYLRGKAIVEAKRNIRYLNNAAAKTALVPVRDAIYSILETQIDKEMLASGTTEYALKVLDPAQPPQLPSSLKPLTWVIIGLFGGLGLSLLLLFFRLAWGKAG